MSCFGGGDFTEKYNQACEDCMLRKIFGKLQLDQSIGKKFYKVFSFIYKKFYLKKKFFPFPNPHLRTTGFMIKGSDFYTYIKDKQIFSKLDAWEIESGKKSLTNYFRNKDYNILLVNSDGACFNEKDWLYSETYNYLNQAKCIISDKHSRKYSNLDDDQKKIYQFHTWGL